MPVSTISSSIDNFITLGSGSYADGVTITNTGTVAPTFEAFNTTTGYSYAVNLLASGDTLMNSGTIVGDPRNAGLPNFGGGGLYLKAGSALNLATIRGGQGAATVGGTGVVVEGGSFDNVGIVIGGSSEPPYTGGAGIAETSGYVVNTGTAAGGPGGAVGTGIGPGAAISGGLFENHGLVISAASGQTGTFVNVGTVEIGNVGGTSTFLNAGIVTDGVAASYSGTFINDGIVTSANTVGGTPNGYGLVLRGTITQPTLQHVLNAGTIIGGVYGVAGGTLTNAGVVQANATGVAVEFLDGNAGLIIDPGAQFQGLVTALPSFASGQEMIVNHTYVPVMITDSNVLEFAAGTHAGSIDLGGSFSGFETIGFDSGSAWTLGGTQAELAGGETINGFARADTLVLDGFSSGTDTYVSGTGLVLSGNSGSATLDVTGSFVTSSFKVIAAGSNSVIELACFAAGTHILTPQGEVAVERLAVGQRGDHAGRRGSGDQVGRAAASGPAAACAAGRGAAGAGGGGGVCRRCAGARPGAVAGPCRGAGGTAGAGKGAGERPERDAAEPG